MAPPAVGESLRADAAIHEGGLLIFGPQQLRESDRIAAEAYGGSVHFDVMCMADAARVAKAFYAGQPLPKIEGIASADVSGKESIDVRSVHCPIAMIAQTTAASAGFSFMPRPPTRTPLIDCSNRD
jgi:hypothetical protein